ncbi:hypothetical protein B0H16DRAFT_1531924 [Mycena metata]|uniref:F-box domain-containing protein n=1 Tax=Mycena metata TaxID=1033252 RepID=A0AAD7JDC1_9AGAR|nr:hypothetical protein B0H16DRAFT_1531924 [Mycena metata]
MIMPIGKLPPELTTKIFELAIQSNVAEGPSSPHTSASTAGDLFRLLHLSHVCSLWRQTIITSPTLWALCPVDVQLDRRQKKYLDGLQMLLDCSAKLPISVSLATTGDTFTGPTGPLILPAIISTASRWRDLDVDTRSVLDLDHLRLPPGTFAALETLRISYKNMIPQAPITLFTLFPRLHCLRVTFSRNSDRDALLQMPWTQLSHVEITDPNPHTCLSALLRCNNIVSAVLITRRYLATLEAAVVMLPCLETLKIECRGASGGIGTFFTQLHLPVLKTLSLAFQDSVLWSASTFAVFQSRAPNIAELSLEGCVIPSHELVAVLQLAPVLKKFTLKYCPQCIDDFFLEAFAFGPDHTDRLVPQLEELDWQAVYHHFDLPIFEAAIRSRLSISDMTSPAVPHLRSVRVVDSMWSQADALRVCLQDLCDQGLTLILS